MNKTTIVSALFCSCICITGCVDNSDVSNIKTPEEVGIDVDFSFKTRTTSNVKLTTINATGKSADNILFSIYDKNPFVQETEDGDVVRNFDIQPIYRGYTDANGSFSKDIAIANGVDKLYIIPEYAGFGTMQEVSLNEISKGIELKGKQIEVPALTSRAGDAQMERNGTKLGTNSTFFHYFNDDEINTNDGSLNVGTGIVTYENLSSEFIEHVNNFFPEQKNNYTGNEENTDMVITAENGAEIWVTYIGDGGFSVTSNQKVCNGLYYYTYTMDNKPSKVYGINYLNSDEYHLTAIFPNVNVKYIATGTKVQLLYWDKTANKYVSTFPKGTHIGFALNFYGYNPDCNTNIKGFSLSSKNNNPYCGTREFNKDGKIHGVIHWDETFESYIVGMERNGIDNDFNDILAKITISEKKQEQTGEVKPPVIEKVSYSQSGTLAFEDNWPGMGDYDFNDFVVEYTYTLTKKEVSNTITDVKMTFTPKASGGAKPNGFAIQLPIALSNVNVATLPQNVEVENLSQLTMIVLNNVRDGFVDAPDGFINTLKGTQTYASAPIEISFSLKASVNESELNFEKFNPFMFSGTRDHEIHLVDYKPTDKMNYRLFNTNNDYSYPSQNVYFRMNNRFPWALDIADVNWKWAYESLQDGITLAYSDYTKWYEDWKEGKKVDWTDNMNENYIW